MALDSPRPLLQPVGRGGLQPHPEQPLHTLSSPGPVPHTQGLSGTLISCLPGTSVPTHRTHHSLVPQEKHTHSLSPGWGLTLPTALVPALLWPALWPLTPIPSGCTLFLYLVPAPSGPNVAPAPRRRGGLT